MLSAHRLYLQFERAKKLSPAKYWGIWWYPARASLILKRPIFAHKDLSALFFKKESMSFVSNQFWSLIVIELHKQPAQEVRVPVTCRRFSLETKRAEKGIVIAAPWHIGTKAPPEWFIFLPTLKQETLSPHCLCLSCTGGVPGEGSTKRDSQLWSSCPLI